MTEIVHTSPKMQADQAVRFMVFETWDEAYENRGYEQPVLREIPEPYAAVLDALCMDDGACASCEAGVGPGLEGDADERAVWRWLTIVHDGARTWMLCEECTSALTGPPEVI